MYEHVTQLRRRATAHAIHRRRIGRYQVFLELASGGMATVYLARPFDAPGSGPLVALKVLHHHLTTDRDFVEMFADEAELAERIRHPNVCNILDYDVVGGEHYLAMEFLVGESLSAVHRRLRRLVGEDPERATRCVAATLAAACEGLHAAHELTDEDGEPLNVVHRDVSPENVFLTYDGIAKIVDFGVASATRKRHRTQTGIIKGKFGYIAPELIRGQTVDRRADIWGIGVIAWELLTGEKLFRGDSDLDTLRAVIDAPVAPPSGVREGLPSGVDDVVLRALARDPDKRYATARELGRDLARLAADGGSVTTSADLGDWMQQLFPGGKEQRMQLVRLSEQLQADEEEEAALTRAVRTRSSRPPGPAVDGPTQVFDPDTPPTSLHRPAPTTGNVTVQRAWARWPAPWILGALLVGAVGGAALTPVLAPMDSGLRSDADAMSRMRTSAHPQVSAGLAEAVATGEVISASPMTPPVTDKRLVLGRYVVEVDGTGDELRLTVHEREGRVPDEAQPPHRIDLPTTIDDQATSPTRSAQRSITWTAGPGPEVSGSR